MATPSPRRQQGSAQSAHTYSTPATPASPAVGYGIGTLAGKIGNVNVNSQQNVNKRTPARWMADRNRDSTIAHRSAVDSTATGNSTIATRSTLPSDYTQPSTRQHERGSTHHRGSTQHDHHRGSTDHQHHGRSGHHSHHNRSTDHRRSTTPHSHHRDAESNTRSTNHHRHQRSSSATSDTQNKQAGSSSHDHHYRGHQQDITRGHQQLPDHSDLTEVSDVDDYGDTTGESTANDKYETYKSREKQGSTNSAHIYETSTPKTRANKQSTINRTQGAKSTLSSLERSTPKVVVPTPILRKTATRGSTVAWKDMEKIQPSPHPRTSPKTPRRGTMTTVGSGRSRKPTLGTIRTRNSRKSTASSVNPTRTRNSRKSTASSVNQRSTNSRRITPTTASSGNKRHSKRSGRKSMVSGRGSRRSTLGSVFKPLPDTPSTSSKPPARRFGKCCCLAIVLVAVTFLILAVGIGVGISETKRLKAIEEKKKSPAYQTEVKQHNMKMPCGVVSSNARTKRSTDTSFMTPSQHDINPVIGGFDTPDGLFPWIVRIVNTCSAAILTDQIILTAAHCLEVGHRNTIHAGISNLNKKGQKRRVSLVKHHPLFSGEKTAALVPHDLALAKLDYRLEFNNEVRPICLPQPGEDPYGRQCTVVGWGQTHREKFPDKLQGLNIRTARCPFGGNDGVPDESLLCSTNGRDGTGPGDSGSPVSCLRTLQQEDGGAVEFAEVAGVVLGGWVLKSVLLTVVITYLCSCVEPQIAMPQLTAVYENVDYYLPWIKKCMEQMEADDGDLHVCETP